MDNQDVQVFGPLVAIPGESLVRLASNVASQNLHLPSSGGKLVARISGSYNISHAVGLAERRIKLVISGSGMTPTAARAMESQVATMHLIRNKTTIPVPEIYALDTTSDNEIGAPYICMSFLPGKPVSEVWFGGPSGTLSQEELRLRILASLSGAMAQFSCLPAFSKMGSVINDRDPESGSTTVIDPLYD